MPQPFPNHLGLALSLAGFLFCANLVSAQSVRIENQSGEFGFGWMFDHRGTCYVVLPEHVAGDPETDFLLTLRTAAPVANGSATVIRPFWEGIDLALAVARGGIVPRCVETIDRLRAPATARRATRAQLERVLDTGEIDRTPITIQDREYLRFFAGVDTGETDIAQGTSGAFAFVGDAPIGMAIRSDDDSRAEFMRIEEIAMNVERYLSEHGTVFQTSPAPALPAPGTDGLPLLLDTSSLPPVNPAFPAEAVLGQGLFVFEASRPLELTFRIVAEASVGLSRLLVTAPTDAGYGFPRDIKVEFSPFADGSRWFGFGTFQMAADGVLDTGAIQPRNARAIRLTVLNVWGENPVAIGAVAAFGG
ncbi:MAG: hypothetical protein QNJ13_06060 [Paracoccaceae bacterium]|nr:hypothetical protein [Paracoccaceae bacterium]